MKRVSFMVLTFLLFCSVSSAGGPSIEIDELIVKDVAVVRDKIIIRASGSIRLFTRKTQEEGNQGGNAKWVSLDAEDIVWTIKKPGQGYTDSRREIRKNWDDYCRKAEDWNGKSVRGQLWFTEITISNGRLATMESEYQVIRIKKEQQESKVDEET